MSSTNKTNTALESISSRLTDKDLSESFEVIDTNPATEPYSKNNFQQNIFSVSSRLNTLCKDIQAAQKINRVISSMSNISTLSALSASINNAHTREDSSGFTTIVKEASMLVSDVSQAYEQTYDTLNQAEIKTDHQAIYEVIDRGALQNQSKDFRSKRGSSLNNIRMALDELELHSKEISNTLINLHGRLLKTTQNTHAIAKQANIIFQYRDSI